jgi:hypothetical protein
MVGASSTLPPFARLFADRAADAPSSAGSNVAPRAAAGNVVASPVKALAPRIPSIIRNPGILRRSLSGVKFSPWLSVTPMPCASARPSLFERHLRQKIRDARLDRLGWIGIRRSGARALRPDSARRPSKLPTGGRSSRVAIAARARHTRSAAPDESGASHGDSSFRELTLGESPGTGTGTGLGSAGDAPFAHGHGLMRVRSSTDSFGFHVDTFQ